MSRTRRILGIPGSLRKGSLNAALLRAASQYLPEGSTLEIQSLLGVPLYNFDIEQTSTPEPVVELRRRIREADGVLIATPEYNYSIPGVLKNALDWASRPPKDSPLTHKPVGIMGTGGMMGTVRAQSHLRQILLYNDSRVMTKPELFVARGMSKFDESGRLVDEQTRQKLEKFLNTFVTWIATWQSIEHQSTTVQNQ
jgi:chromate reductase